MKKMRNNKGFTLVELLAVIVVLAIVMGIASIAITNVLETTKKSTFVSSAKMYITGARDVIALSEVMTNSTYKLPVCQANSTTKIPVSAIETEGGEQSPYGGDYNKADSYVQIAATSTDNYSTCIYTYSIYLTDDTYAIGTETSPVLESSLDEDEVKPETGA